MSAIMWIEAVSISIEGTGGTETFPTQEKLSMQVLIYRNIKKKLF